MKNFSFLAFLFVFLLSGCAGSLSGTQRMIMGPGSNATQIEKECHMMAQDGRFMGALQKAGIGTGLGAATGAVTGNIGRGAGYGALSGIFVGGLMEGQNFETAYQTCLNNHPAWKSEHESYWKQQYENQKSTPSQQLNR